MGNLIAELVIRLAKPAATALLAIGLYLVLVGLLGESGSVTLALLSWLAAAAFVLLIQEGPI